VKSPCSVRFLPDTVEVSASVSAWAMCSMKKHSTSSENSVLSRARNDKRGPHKLIHVTFHLA